MPHAATTVNYPAAVASIVRARDASVVMVPNSEVGCAILPAVAALTTGTVAFMDYVHGRAVRCNPNIETTTVTHAHMFLLYNYDF